MKRLFWLFLLLIPLSVGAQDVHFSQFYNALMNVNPSLTGVGAKPLRIGLLYRNQWSSISTPYRTYTAFADGRFTIGRLQRTWFGTGIAAYNDRAGDGVLNNTTVSLGFSVTRGFSRDNTLLVSVGFSLGLLNRSIQFSNLIFDEQWDGVKFDPSQANNEPFASQSVMALDFNLGLLIVYDISYNMRASVGASRSHINNPNQLLIMLETASTVN